jgi:hypothetical protein
MTYTKQTWADSPATTTPISAARLGHVEDGIEAAHVAAAAVAGAAMVVVNHGADAAVARPVGAAAVYWIGSVAPANAIASDMWWSA